MRPDYFVIFFVSLFCITLELFLTRILNLKAWNHLVYVIIPFAILGYGIGANIYLIFRNKINQFKKNNVIAASLLTLSLASIVSSAFLIRLPIHREYLVNFFTHINAVTMLLIAYAVVMIPFVAIGFLVVYLFSVNPQKSSTLYFSDLVGAGLGSLAFFFLINRLAVFRSLALFSVMTFSLFLLFILSKRKKILVFPFLLLATLCLRFVPEPTNYAIDPTKGWEWIPGWLHTNQYETVVSQWHPLGRTEIYRIKDDKIRKYLETSAPGTFEINLVPPPEFSYVATNSLSGTPIYKLSAEGLKEYDSRVDLFSQAMETPYALLSKPKVVIIGTGGGRDIFVAKTHGASEIVGAEINPAIYSQMSPGGKFYDYSGKIYTLDGVRLFNIDGRHLVKRLGSNHFDLVVLNGVDTFSGLSSGAYAYAESYLYTKNAILDYLRILNQNGVISFTRWIFPDMPREELRLLAICLDALRSSGVERPWDHVIIGAPRMGWSIILVKKTPFTAEEKSEIKKYFQGHDTSLLFPTQNWENKLGGEITFFDRYAQSFIEGNENAFATLYPYDISVISDDNPFFYKYYKFKSFNPSHPQAVHHTGTIIFMTQVIVLIQAMVFIVLFIFFPLFLFKRSGIKGMPPRARVPFIIFFSCLGVGFMFIEISLMQRFVLLLGSPIHSISVTLTALLIFSGLGSLLLGYLLKIDRLKKSLMLTVTLLLCLLLFLLVSVGTGILDRFMGSSFAGRVFVSCLLLFPLGICLGMFFPAGLQLIGRNYRETIAWAWGINCGFSVLGSMGAIILAQWSGFNSVLLLAIATYLIALLAFERLKQSV